MRKAYYQNALKRFILELLTDLRIKHAEFHATDHILNVADMQTVGFKR